MALPVVYRRKVGRDLAGAYGWYEEQRAGLGEEFLAAVDTSFNAIQEYPEIFSRVHGEVRRAVVSRFPYAVFYRVEARRVVCLRFFIWAVTPSCGPNLGDMSANQPLHRTRGAASFSFASAFSARR